MGSTEHTFEFHSPARGSETVGGEPAGNANILPPYRCQNDVEGCDGGRCDYCRYGRCAGCGCDGLNCMCPAGRSGLPLTFEAMLDDLHADCRRIMLQRQRKYGRHNIPRYGTTGTVVRMGDKFARLEYMLQEGAAPAADESIEDTLIDISNYANIMRAQLRGWWTKESCPPLEENL